MKSENEKTRHPAVHPVEPEHGVPRCDTGPLGRLRFVVRELAALLRRRG